MYRKILILSLGLLALGLACRAEDDVFAPTATVKYAQKDSCELFLDYYAPAEGKVMTPDGRQKPTVLFMFGGGFAYGARDRAGYRKWFEALCGNGYGVVSIDYRLWMKGRKVKKLDFPKELNTAVSMAVEDLFSATLYLIRNGYEMGIDAANLVLAGSSAGAMAVLLAENDICNGRKAASVLPVGFNYVGVMSFSGAIFSMQGDIAYDSEPCPQILFHGTKDNIVSYRKLHIFKLCLDGSDGVAKVLDRNGYNYNIFRYPGRSHEIANSMYNTLPLQLMFLETNIIGGRHQIIDAEVTDTGIYTPEWIKEGLKGIY